MEVRPPYLVDPGEPGARGLSMVSDVATATVEITVRGRWSRRLGAELLTAIRKCPAEQPSVVIADVRGLAGPDGDSAPMWLVLLIPSGPDPDDPPEYARGQGLRLVDDRAGAWGAMAAGDGKVVWATLRSPREDTP